MEELDPKVVAEARELIPRSTGRHPDVVMAEDARDARLRDGKGALTLAEAWEEGLWEGYEWVSACCGCAGKGDEPPNPYAEEPS